MGHNRREVAHDTDIRDKDNPYVKQLLPENRAPENRTALAGIIPLTHTHPWKSQWLLQKSFSLTMLSIQPTTNLTGCLLGPSHYPALHLEGKHMLIK